MAKSAGAMALNVDAQRLVAVSHVEGPMQSAFDSHCTQYPAVVLQLAAPPPSRAEQSVLELHVHVSVVGLQVPDVQSESWLHSLPPQAKVKLGAGFTTFHAPVV